MGLFNTPTVLGQIRAARTPRHRRGPASSGPTAARRADMIEIGRDGLRGHNLDGLCVPAGVPEPWSASSNAEPQPHRQLPPGARQCWHRHRNACRPRASGGAKAGPRRSRAVAADLKTSGVHTRGQHRRLKRPTRRMVFCCRYDPSVRCAGQLPSSLGEGRGRLLAIGPPGAYLPRSPNRGECASEHYCHWATESQSSGRTGQCRSRKVAATAERNFPGDDVVAPGVRSRGRPAEFVRRPKRSEGPGPRQVRLQGHDIVLSCPAPRSRHEQARAPPRRAPVV